MVYILNFIKENKKYKHKILSYFVAIMNGEIEMPPELIEFCMRELQWPEIKNLAIQKLEQGDPRKQYLMEHIVNVYEKNWDDADLYEYYSKEAKH